MGLLISQTYIEGNRPNEIPGSFEKPGFEPELGFKGPRKPRVSQLTEQEMLALKIPKQNRDYCAHIYRDYMLCRRQYAPFTAIMCGPEYHEFEHCRKEDYILRMKEYEREKRLRMRELRKQQAA